ncbi:MAG: FRG domain-containing protein [Chloroflexota bacterium]|nr:MAG: FRG domain-containing protein [Chloroflexota bacterium]
MTVEVIEVRSWNELDEVLSQDVWNETLQRFRSTSVFRGVPYVWQSLESGLKRLGYPEAQTRKMESIILNSFIKYANYEFTGRDSLWNLLSLGQHHGLPTRLLDWTYSPYVAMHFAVGSMPDTSISGVIWRVDVNSFHAHLPQPLRSSLESEGFSAFTTDILDRHAKTLAEFDALSRDVFALFFEPPSLDARIVNQYALFSIMSDPNAALDDWLEEQGKRYTKIIIPGSLKLQLRDRLDWLNITERVLFPGLDGLCQWLRRYYTPFKALPPDEK